MLAVVNGGEDELDNISAEEHKVAEAFNDAGDNVEAVSMCVAQLTRAISDPMGVPKCSTRELARERCSGWCVRPSPSRITHLFSPPETRSRMDVREGSTAPSVRRTNSHRFQQGFIRAEVIEWEQLLELARWVVKRRQTRLEKDYIAATAMSWSVPRLIRRSSTPATLVSWMDRPSRSGCLGERTTDPSSRRRAYRHTSFSGARHRAHGSHLG